MKRTIDVNKIYECIENGINTASGIAKELNFSCSAIFTFCKRKNISIEKAGSGGLNFVDLSNQTINGVEILERVLQDNSLSFSRAKLAKWKCKCPCGNIFESIGADIRQNRVKTCGCRISIESKRNWKGGKFVSQKYWQVLNSNAKQRNLELSIDINYLDEIFEQQDFKCKLTGTLLSFSGTPKLHTASLDRIDSTKGYIEGNVQWVHKVVNIMKSNMTDEEFIEWCKKVVKHVERI